MGYTSGKIWGTTELLLASPLFEIHKLNIKPNAECSQHMHRWKWNFFLVVSGELFIDVEKNDYQLIDETRLGPGDAVTVKPGEYHQFRTGKKPCLAYEIYYCEPLSQDIIRRNVGSIQNKRPKKR